MKNRGCKTKILVENTFVKYLLLLVVLATLIGTTSAAAVTMNDSQSTDTARVQGIYLVAGPDSTIDPATYPAATVVVAPTNDSATIAFSLFPSEPSTPQPATYYTNLLQITNTATINCTINSIKISGITGASNLGCITIYYYATQTDDPQNNSPIGYATLTSTSTDTIALISAYTLAAGTTNYIEIVGYANPNAAVDSTIGFNLEIQCLRQ
jgi:hypothetical protein